MPLAGLVYVSEHWPWDGELGEILCRGSEFAKDISIGVSIFTLVALASDRYTGIVNVSLHIFQFACPLFTKASRIIYVFTASEEASGEI